MEQINASAKPAGRRARKTLEKAALQEESLLLAQLTQAKLDTENIARIIDFVKDPMVLEDLIYKLKAAQTRFRYFLQKARAAGICARDLALVSAAE